MVIPPALLREGLFVAAKVSPPYQPTGAIPANSFMIMIISSPRGSTMDSSISDRGPRHDSDIPEAQQVESNEAAFRFAL